MQAKTHATCNIICKYTNATIQGADLYLYVYAYKKISKTCSNFLIGSFCWQHAHAYIHKNQNARFTCKGMDHFFF